MGGWGEGREGAIRKRGPTIFVDYSLLTDRKRIQVNIRATLHGMAWHGMVVLPVLVLQIVLLARKYKFLSQ